MSPAENKRAKRRKNKKGRLSNTQVASKSNEFNEMAPVDDMPEIDISEIKDRFCQGLDMRTSTVSSEKIICIKCHRPQTNSDLQKSSSKLGEYSAGLLEGFRVSRDLHLCDEKKIELGIPDPLWLCEDCENFLLPPENKVTYNSYRRHDLRQPHSLLRVETEMLRERENELLNTTIFEAQMDNPADMVSLMGTPMANTATNSGACLCAACCERKQVENEEEEECRELKRGWLDIKAYLHKVYKEEGLYLSEPHTNSSSGASIGESSLIDYLTQSLTKKKKATQNPSIETLKEWVHRLCKQDPQHLFLCLESQVKLFISEMRSRLLSLLKHLPDSCKGMAVDRAVEGNGIEELGDEGVSENRGDSNLAMALKACLQSKFPNNYDGDIFLLWVCHEYQTLCSASRRLAPILEELELTHLKNFNLTWELVNRHLFRSIVYSDSTLLLQIQRCCLNCSCALHLNIEQNFSQKTSSHVWPSQSSKCSSPSNGSSGTHGGVECPTLARFSKLDDEMTVINVVYREAMNLIEEFNKRQMVQAKQRFKDWESFHVQWKMMEQEVLNKKNAFAKAFYQKSLLQCQNNNSQTTPDTPMTDTIQLPSNNLNLPNTGGSNNCKNLGILNLNEDALIKLMSSNETVSGSSSNCSSSPSSSCSSSSESSSASSMLSPGAVVEIQQGGEDLKLLLQEITKLNSSEILPKQVTDLLINSAGLVSQSSSSSIPVSVPSNSPDKVATFTGVKCEGTPTPISTGCLRKHRGDVSPSFFSSQHKNPRSDINSFRRNEYLNLYNPVKIKSSLPLHTTQSVLDKNKDSPIELNSSCECHDCLTQKNLTFNLLPSTENTNSSSSSISPPSTAPPPVGSYPLLPNHLSEIARSAASHLASKALIHPHLYNLHARKAAKSNSAVVLEANKKPAAEFGQSPIPGISHQSNPGSGTNSIDFELVAKEVFREQVKLAAQGEWSLDIVKNKVAEAVMGNLGITNNQANGSNSTSPGSLTSPNGSGCIQSKNFFSPIQRKGSTTPRSRSGSSGDISNSPGTPSPTTSHNVGTQSDALPPGGSPLKTTQGTSCAMGGPANSNIPSGKNRNAPNSSTETLKVNGNSKPFLVTESSTPTLNQRDQVVMTEGSASVAVGTTAQSSECQMTARHNHHHHHHSRDQCCESVLPPNGAGNYTEGDESGLDDSCSERSSSTSTSNPRESRVCDCCYCEVFGHGVPVVAPVSRNYPEMRERLRLRLSKRKAEGSAGSSKTTQHLSNSPSSNNLPDNLPLVTDKNSHGKLATSADDRELDALLRYINGTDLDPESDAAHLHQDHQHGCSGNCRKPVNATTRISSTKAANKKQRKKAKKAIIDEKNLDKKESISPPIRETFHANRENTRESLHRDVKKVRSASPFESRVINDINNIPQVSKPQLKATRMSENAKGARTRLLEEESGPIKALANRAVSNDENLSNFKNKNGKLVSQSRSKTPVSNQPLLNEEDLHREISPIATLAKELVSEKEHVVVSGPKKNSSRLNGIVPVSVINNAPIRNISSNTQSNTAPAPLRSKKNKKKKNCVEDSSSLDEVFLPKDIDLDNGELDEVEKELEAFKRFCMASVPLANKEKVHVNLKDIVIKKKVNNTNGNAATAP